MSWVLKKIQKKSQIQLVQPCSLSTTATKKNKQKRVCLVPEKKIKQKRIILTFFYYQQ
jgi:hypothetical protein